METRRDRALAAIEKFRTMQLKNPGFGTGSRFPDDVKKIADPDIYDAVMHGLSKGIKTLGFKQMTETKDMSFKEFLTEAVQASPTVDKTLTAYLFSCVKSTVSAVNKYKTDAIWERPGCLTIVKSVINRGGDHIPEITYFVQIYVSGNLKLKPYDKWSANKAAEFACKASFIDRYKGPNQSAKPSVPLNGVNFKPSAQVTVTKPATQTTKPTSPAEKPKTNSKLTPQELLVFMVSKFSAASRIYQRDSSAEKNGNGWELGIRDWGRWETPADAEDDGDYDWQILSKVSRDKADAICKDLKKQYPYAKFSYTVGEKNWLYLRVEV